MTRGDLTRYVAAAVLLVAAFVSVAVVVRRHAVVDGPVLEQADEATNQPAAFEHRPRGLALGRDATQESALASVADAESSKATNEAAGPHPGRRSLWQCLTGVSMPIEGGPPDQGQVRGSELGMAPPPQPADGQAAEPVDSEPAPAAESSSSDVPTEDLSDTAGTAPTPVQRVVFRFYELSNQWVFTRDVPPEAWGRIRDELLDAIERHPDDKGVPDAIYALSQMVSDKKYPDMKRCLLESCIFHPRADPTLQIMVLPELIPYCDPLRQFCLWSWRNELILGLPNEPMGEGRPNLRDGWMPEYYEGLKWKGMLAGVLLERGISLDSPELPERDRGKKPSDHLRELLALMPQIRAAPPPGVNCDELEAETLSVLGSLLMSEAALQHTTIIYPPDGGPARHIVHGDLPPNEEAAEVFRELRMRFPEQARRLGAAFDEALARDPSGGLVYLRTLEECEKTIGSTLLSYRIGQEYLRLGQGRPFIERWEKAILAGTVELSNEPVAQPLRSDRSSKQPEYRANDFLELARAYTKADVEDWEKAIGHYERAFSLMSSNERGRPQAFREIIWAYQRVGDYEKALHYAEQLVAEHPEGSGWVPSDVELLEELRATVQSARQNEGEDAEKGGNDQ